MMRFQFALIVIAVLAAPLVVADDHSVESNAIAKIELLGGRVTRDETLPSRPVIAVEFQENMRFNDGYLHLLKSFTSLTSLNLAGSRITDAGLKEIRDLKSLTLLNLYLTKVSDAGLRELVGLQNLTFLSLSNTNITDASMKEIGEFRKLKTLELEETQVTDDGDRKSNV